MARSSDHLRAASPLLRARRSALLSPTRRMRFSIATTTGWNIRANFGFDLASNTAYGPLIGHFDINSDLGNGLDSPRRLFHLCQHRLCDLGGHHGW